MQVITSENTVWSTKVAKVAFLGAPLSLGQTHRGVELTPDALRGAGLASEIARLGLEWRDLGNVGGSLPAPMFAAVNAGVESANAKNGSYPVRHCPEISRYCEEIAAEVEKAALSGNDTFVLTAGGDHSIALGSISGMLRARPQMGLVWVDAHGDFNTPATSQSGNFHGMPLAALLGYRTGLLNFDWLEQEKTKFAPSRTALVGVRAVDQAERELLRESGVSVFSMKEVDRYGIGRVMERALESVDPHGTRPLHVSYDIDAVDPAEAPGTGTLAKGGLTYRESHLILEILAETGRLGSMDLVEINPALEPGGGGQTVALGVELVLSALGKTIF